MAGTKVEEILLTAGQNEGIDVAVLPAPQLRNVSNMRLRSGSRWGKRFGHTALNIATVAASLGSGARPRCVGGAGESCFMVVDDRCFTYDQQTATFVFASNIDVASSPRTPGSVSGWLPDTSFFPVPARSVKNQTATPCSVCYAFGYLFTAISYTTVGIATDKTIRVTATNVSDQTLVRMWEFSPTNTTFGGLSYPKLVLVGSTLVLSYAYDRSAVAKDIVARNLTSVAGGWGAETVLTALAGTVDYDITSYNTTQFALVVAATASVVTLYVASTLLTAGLTQAIADSSGNPLTTVSVVGSAGAEIYVGYGVAATPSSKVRVFTANLAGVTGTATLAGSAVKPLLALVNGGVRVVYTSTLNTATLPALFRFGDVDTAAALSATTLFQTSAYPISSPFTVAGTTYIWTKIENGGPSYPVLLKLPAPSSYFGPAVITLPIEASPQDLLMTSSAAAGAGAIDLKGVPTPTQIGTTATYAMVIPVLQSTPSTIALGHEFRVVQLKHFSAAERLRSVRSMSADMSSFIPMGALTRVDDRGAIEEGFLHPPQIRTPVPAAGGALTAASDYYYTAIYKSRNNNGRVEVSAPCPPVRATMAALQTQNTLTIVLLGATARPATSIEIYRTLSNEQTFYLVGVIDTDITGTFGTTTFVDQTADSVIDDEKALYTQVGQTLPNAFPPPSRFGCVGGQRLFLGGLVRPDVVQASKLIFGDQSPSFADSDAFRIVLPAPCTGVAWMDTLCLFTAEGIYIASGDGPDDAGIGDFGTLTRMPYELGCIEPRSVIVTDEGCFFQNARGLYLLPRGFGTPVPAGDNVQNTLGSYPVITGCVALTKTREQSIHWTCSDSAGVVGQRIVYDIAHKAWGVDDISGSSALCGAGSWSGNEVALFRATLSTSALPVMVTNSVFSDGANAISVFLSTGQLRPFGTLSEGSIIKAQVLAELRDACTMTVSKFSEWGGSSPTRVFALAVNDYQIGQLTTTEIEMGPTEARNASRVQLQISESSTTEGLAFIAIALEHEQGEGLKRASPLSRVT